MVELKSTNEEGPEQMTPQVYHRGKAQLSKAGKIIDTTTDPTPIDSVQGHNFWKPQRAKNVSKFQNQNLSLTQITEAIEIPSSV